MPLISVVITLIVVGIVLWVINTYLSAVIDAKILQIINVLVIIVVVLWLLSLFLPLGNISQFRVGPPG